jgi:hypothetical protein
VLGESFAHAQEAEAEIEAEADAAAGAWFADERGLTAKVSGGPAVHRLYGFWVISGDVELALGSQTRSGGWYGTVGGRVGSSDGGLPFRQVTGGASWEAPLEPRWHVGIGLDLSVAWFDRVSADGALIAPGIGGRAFTSYDVLHHEDGALFLGLELGADAYSGDEVTPLYGGGLRLGARIF